MRKLSFGVAMALPLVLGTAHAEDTVKIGYIDPLSGGGASVGEDRPQDLSIPRRPDQRARAAYSATRSKSCRMDNKTNPQESLVQAQKAADDGIHYITQGNGSSVGAALEDFVTKNNERNPGKEDALFQLCRGRSEHDQREVQLLALPLGRQLGHQDGGAHQLHEGPAVHQEGLPDQPGLFVRPVGPHAGAQDAGRKAAGHPDRRRRAAPASQGHRLLALHRQNQGLRRRHAS